MINQVKSGLKFALRPAARMLTARQPKILMYHRFSQDESEHATPVDLFRRQVELLKREFTILTMRDIVRRGSSVSAIDKHLAAITVDDGYEDFYRCAFPVLRELDVPATLFVSGGFVSRELWLWPDLLRAVLGACDGGKVRLSGFWQGQTISWSNASERESTWSKLADKLLPESTSTRYGAIQAVAESAGIDTDDLDMSPYQPLSWAQLRELHAAGIEIGDHTWSHCNLARMSKSEIGRDVTRSREAIAENIGGEVVGFAYPNGTPDDYNREAARTIRELGFEYAVVAHPRRFHWNNVYEIGRLDGSDRMRTFRNVVAGFRLLRSDATARTHPGPT